MKRSPVSLLLNRRTNERRHLQQYDTTHQGILSCIRTFPTEILEKIFMQTVDNHYDVFDTKRGPWALGHVCRRWKDISRSYPALWTALAIESLHLQPESRRSYLPEILEEVLVLTGNQELDVRYSLQSLIVNDGNTHRGRSKVLWGDRKSSFWNVLQGLFDMLVGHSMRWRSASFVVPCKLGGRRLRQAKGRLSSLVSFDLSLCEGLGEGVHFDSKTLDALSIPPKLQVLTVTDVPIDVLPSLPWSQMRYLSHDFLTSIEGHLYLLAKSPLLETYIASFYDPSPWEELELHCTHNHLRRLELSC
ncbi:uncharacterized protein EV420DRAFT_983296 [Desarmillaria tabescens]|uniref:F-box domain-containing protein n=1 Tax=Armillaria tabescens TaxID=1929756 RepID=A0AA39JLN0_ARMTA|nr:uncharacterized protein EV420DRAFT_983296 [Desarmillaria tabescens]KAK0445042.1 hypothetical protein EV420DRAFT_983296 [Desarmillaria tabescens]